MAGESRGAINRKSSQRTKKGAKKKEAKVVVKRVCQVLPGFGNVQWHNAITSLFKLIKSEPKVDETGLPFDYKQIKREETFTYLCQKYIQYIQVFQKLVDCLPRLIHPQKRKLLKKCIESTGGRICEIKHQMINWDRSLIHYFDDLLQDMGLIPENLEIPIPVYMLHDRREVLGMRQQLLAWMLKRIETAGAVSVEELTRSGGPSQGPESVKSKVDNVPKEVKSAEETHRYVPDGRCMLLIREINRIPAMMAKVVKIQCAWRGWLCRQKVNKLRDAEFEDLGMKMPTGLMAPVETIDMVEYEEKENMYFEREEEYNVSKVLEYEKYVEQNGMDLALQMKLNLTQWLLEMRDLQGEFPDYPEDEEGGCDEIFKLKTVEEVMEELDEMDDPKQKAPEPAKKKEQPAKPAKKDFLEDPGYMIPASGFMVGLIHLLNEYNSFWYCKYEGQNPFQRFDKERLLDEVRSEAGKVIRTQVDKLMRYELEKLKFAVDDKIYKSTIDRKKKETVPRDKKKADPTGTKTVEELYGELVLMGLVKPVNSVRFKDIIGDNNYQRDAQRGCIPTACDVKNVVSLLLGLPLNSQFIHSKVPLISSLMFAGPPGTGKTMLVHAICRETGSNLIDLSPSNLQGKYIGTVEMNYLKFALLRVGKAMEPTVFYIDECDNLYSTAKWLGKKEDNPARWMSFFPALMKMVKNGDRMVLIGETHNPFNCKRPQMFSMFKNVLLFTIPEYGSRTAIWSAFLARLPAFKASTLNVSVLSKMTEGYTAREIQFVVDNVLHADRISRKRAVTNEEFLQCLGFMGKPPDVTEVWTNWYMSTPMVKQHMDWLRAMDELDELLDSEE